MLTLKTELTLPAVGMTGFETPLSEEEQAIQQSVHRFAKEVLRPLGRELDKRRRYGEPASPLPRRGRR